MGSTILSFKNVRKAFGGVYALSGVSFDVEKGECLALVAPDWTNIVALTEDDRVVFVRQWRFALGEFTLALTLGHTILGQTSAALDVARTHEWVHVRQFERWGPLMGPAYLGCSLWLWLRGGRPYRDNPFEREAYDEAG